MSTKSESLIVALKDVGYDPRAYGGRGMYGKRCVAITGDDITVWGLAKALFSEQFDGQFNRLSAPQQDQLGLGIVLYWPSYEWPNTGTTKKGS